MSASFYDLLKYAATGIASPDMTYYDKMRASTLMGGGTVQTLTGIPPLSFKSDGTPLISWSMKGNGSQTGTPTPDNPVMPEFVGNKTANLWNEDYTGISGSLKYVPVFVGDGTFTLSTDTPIYQGNAAPIFLLSGNVTSGASTPDNGVYNGVSRTKNSSKGYITIAFRRQSESSDPTTHKTMLNSGSTALPYEPFGWAEKITCAGQTTPVYLGQVSTVRRVKKYEFTGDERWSVISGKFYLQEISPDYQRAPDALTYFCSHFPVYPQTNRADNVPDNMLSFGASSVTQRVYCTYTGVSTAVDFKSYLAAQYAAGNPVTVWYVLATPETGIVNEPLAKIGTYADELHSEDAGITIPTVKGSNALTVDMPIQPSEMTITYKG